MDNIIVISSIFFWVLLLFNMFLTIALVRKVNNKTISSSPPDFTDLPTPEIGTPAPMFEARALEGNKVTLETFANKAVAIIFMSANCPSCTGHIPTLNAFKPKAKRAGVELIVAHIGTQDETEDFVLQNNLSLPTLVAPRESSLAQNYIVPVTPFYCFIDEKGVTRSAGAFGPHLYKLVSEWEN